MSQNDNNQNFINNIKARIGYFEFVALLASLMAINAIAIDIMLPATHQMGDSLQIAQENDQHYIIFSYLIMLCESSRPVLPVIVTDQELML